MPHSSCHPRIWTVLRALYIRVQEKNLLHSVSESHGCVTTHHRERNCRFRKRKPLTIRNTQREKCTRVLVGSLDGHVLSRQTRDASVKERTGLSRRKYIPNLSVSDKTSATPESRLSLLIFVFRRSRRNSSEFPVREMKHRVTHRLIHGSGKLRAHVSLMKKKI